MNVHPSALRSTHNYTSEQYSSLKTTAEKLNHSLAHREYLLLGIQSQTDYYQGLHAEIHGIYADLRELERGKHQYPERHYTRVKEGLLDRRARQRMRTELARYDIRCLRRVLMEVKQRVSIHEVPRCQGEAH